MNGTVCHVCGEWVCQYQRIDCRVVKCGKWCVDYKQVRIPRRHISALTKAENPEHRTQTQTPKPIPSDLLGFCSSAAASQRCFLESPGDLFGITVNMQSILIDTVCAVCVRARGSVRYFPVSHKRLGIRVRSPSVDGCKCHSWDRHNIFLSLGTNLLASLEPGILILGNTDWEMEKANGGKWFSISVYRGHRSLMNFVYFYCVDFFGANGFWENICDKVRGGWWAIFPCCESESPWYSTVTS